MFRILHISDLHISNQEGRFNCFAERKFRATQLGHNRLLRPTTYSHQRLHSLCQWICRNQCGIDAIVVTGDITDLGRDEDLRVAVKHTIVESTSDQSWLTRQGFPTIRIAGIEVFLIPGNHDRYCADGSWLSFYSPGSPRFEGAFGEYWRVGQGAAEIGRLGDRHGNVLSMIGGDFSLRDSSHASLPFGTLGQGRAYRDVLGEMVALSDQAREECGQRIILVWAVHFPFEYPERKRLLELVHGDRVADAIQAARVDIVLCGHQHQSWAGEVGGASVFCATSACENSDRTKLGCHLLECDIGEGEVRCNWRSFFYQGGDFLEETEEEREHVRRPLGS